MDLLELCTTDLQRDVISRWLELAQNTNGTVRSFPDHDPRYVQRIIKRVKIEASSRGWSPEHDMEKVVPESHVASRVTTAYKDGEPMMQWVRADLDRSRLDEHISDFVEGLKAELKPYRKQTRAKKQLNSDLLSAYIISDYHMGMFADAMEAGSEWNLEIAERVLMEWFDQAVKMAPDSEEGLFVQLGDFGHWDGYQPKTPQSGHIVDAAGRPHQMVSAIARVLRHVCDLLLKKHKRVRVINATGNHDIFSSIWMRELLNHVYSKEPRLTVDMNPDVYYCYRWGKVALFAHHGHKKRMGQIADVFVRKFKDDYCAAEHHYAWMGHLHHIDVKENNLMIIEQVRTLAAPDSHAALGGWMSGRSANVVTYHKEFGEVCRHSISTDMFAKTIDLR